MAVAPLFVANMSSLLGALRLNGAEQALAVVDTAVQEVRSGFYQMLGSARVVEILAKAYSENPTTDDGLLRLRATTVEIAWVRLLLLRKMPVLFQDAGAGAQQGWNDATVVRVGSSDLAREITRLQLDVNEGLAYLNGVEGDEGISAAAIGPNETTRAAFPANTAPGTKIYAGYGDFKAVGA